MRHGPERHRPAFDVFLHERGLRFEAVVIGGSDVNTDGSVVTRILTRDRTGMITHIDEQGSAWTGR